MSTLAEEMKTHALEAQKFSRKHLVLELDFSEASIQELENQCDTVEYAIRGGKSPENLEMLTRIWGAYIGEAIRRATDGQWREDSQSGSPRYALEGTNAARVYPHEEVRKRLTGTSADSLLTFFRNARAQLKS